MVVLLPSSIEKKPASASCPPSRKSAHLSWSAKTEPIPVSSYYCLSRLVKFLAVELTSMLTKSHELTKECKCGNLCLSLMVNPDFWKIKEREGLVSFWGLFTYLVLFSSLRWRNRASWGELDGTRLIAKPFESVRVFMNILYLFFSSALYPQMNSKTREAPKWRIGWQTIVEKFRLLYLIRLFTSCSQRNIKYFPPFACLVSDDLRVWKYQKIEAVCTCTQARFHSYFIPVLPQAKLKKKKDPEKMLETDEHEEEVASSYDKSKGEWRAKSVSVPYLTLTLNRTFSVESTTHFHAKPLQIESLSLR